jgi:hypothetical protein
MKDAKGHGSNPRGGNGQFQTSTGVTRAAREVQAMRALVDARKFAAGRTSNRNINPPVMPGDVAHLRGIMAATTGKSLSLAQTSALGATTANIKGGN